MPVHTPRIAIIGAGPAGLILLNVLARNGVPATVYERDETFESRAHLGGTLDLLADSGQAAMKGAGLWDAFLEHSRPEGQEMRFVDSMGELLFHYEPPAEAQQHVRPEIDRTVLRKIMVDAAPAGSIKWGHAFTRAARVAGSAEWELTFANGRKVVVDLLVGADGGRSHVRPLVSDADAAYTGVTGVEVSFESSAHPELAARIGNGTLMAFAQNRAIVSQRNGDGRIRTYAWYKDADADFIPSIAATDPERTVAEVAKRYEGWAPWLREIIEVADRHAVYPRSLCVLPVGHSWAHRPGVTLIGDSMNLMTPYAGKGANVAMLAGLKLGLAIASAGGVEQLDAKVAEYEKEIIPLAEKDAAETDKNFKMAMFAENGAKEYVLQSIARSTQGA